MVGTYATINAEATLEFWDSLLGSFWLLRPAMPPPVGDYMLRYEEPCNRTDGGSYEQRLHTVELPFRFTFDSPLPTSAGSLTADQGISDEKPVVAQVVTAEGVCQIQSFKWAKVWVLWNLASELPPFIEAVQAVSRRANGAPAYQRNYGRPADPPGAVGVIQEMINCYPPMSNDAGFVNGRGTFTLRSHLAGAAQDFPLLSVDVQLDCPPPEVGPCPDAGTDAGPDGTRGTTDGEAGAVPPSDVRAVDDRGTGFLDAPSGVDATPNVSPDAPLGAVDGQGPVATTDGAASDGTGARQDDASPASDAAGPVDASSPPEPPDAGEDRGCSVGKVGDGSAEAAKGWLLSVVLLAGTALRRRFRSTRHA
jgi:hypothetical protein